MSVGFRNSIGCPDNTCGKSHSRTDGLQERNPAAAAWIIHGFRGNKEVAQSLIRHGFYLSFGEKYQEEALAVTPPERLLLETDESPVSAAQLCRHMADVLQTSVPALTAQLQQTIKSLFFNP